MFDNAVCARRTLEGIENAINSREGYAKMPVKNRAYRIQKESHALNKFIHHYLNEDQLYLHHVKKAILYRVTEEIQHLFSVARIGNEHGLLDEKELNRVLGVIRELFVQFAAHGSLYCFRHCDKDKKRRFRGVDYTGITKEAVRTQALAQARNIYCEVMLSPIPVKLFLRNSEQRRTEIFAKIIKHVVAMVDHVSPGKATIDGPRPDNHIAFGLWSKQAIDELSKCEGLGLSEDQFFFDWFNQRSIIKENFEHQPNPQTVIKSVHGFIGEFKPALDTHEHYTIAIGISHSYILDAYICSKFPDTEQNIGHIIKEAAFFKVECNQFCYLGRWVNL